LNIKRTFLFSFKNSKPIKYRCWRQKKFQGILSDYSTKLEKFLGAFEILLRFWDLHHFEIFFKKKTNFLGKDFLDKAV